MFKVDYYSYRIIAAIVSDIPEFKITDRNESYTGNLVLMGTWPFQQGPKPVLDSKAVVATRFPYNSNFRAHSVMRTDERPLHHGVTGW